MRILLRPFGWLYGLITTLRNLLFDAGILPSEVFSLPVISVGNLVAGGSGKSPHVLMLVELLKRDYRVAVLSRGYGRKTRGFRLVKKNETSETVGDEPLQYLYYHPEIKVAVCEDRRTGIRLLMKTEYKPEIILLDDAFQHRYVKAGMNILLTEFDRPFTKDHLLPEGMLRETRSGAERASIILVTKSPVELNQKDELYSEISRYSPAPVEFTYMRYRDPVSLDENVALDIKSATTVLLLTGIAQPEPLVKHFGHPGMKLKHLRYGDHYEFTSEDIDKIIQEFKVLQLQDSSTVIITTRKDAMRLLSPELLPAIKNLPVYVVDIEVRFHDGISTFKESILKYVRSFT